MQRIDDFCGIVHGQRRLCDVGQLVRIADGQCRHIVNAFHQVDITAVAAIILAHGAFHFRMSGMTNQNAFAPFCAETGHFQMHFGDQRTGSVKHLKSSQRGFLLYLL